jgi:hypothetical protein|uniref:Methyltransferase FkbM domain-containing protein n=1 Tax=viral metagenome TaxID=1070528 RepID=A0A6C0F144_9ZZZZ
MSYSQAGQDVFVSHATKFKKNGTFLEIGTNHPITDNNSYILETKYGWSGLLVEYNNTFESLYKIHRKSKYIIADARTIDYRAYLDSNNFPTNIDYLQIDLDVNNRSTLDTLELFNNTVFDKYKFACITFEHDIYTGNYFNTRNISREIFKNRGYVAVFKDVRFRVKTANGDPFEDWYVNPDLVDMDYINNIKTDTSLKWEEIIEIIKKTPL